MHIVGHGRGGMEWVGGREGQHGQEEAIQKFNAGICKLLITTSVLEEGLDVR